MALLTNGGNANDLYQDLYQEIFAEVAGVDMPAPLTPSADPETTDLTPWLGTYERAGGRIEIATGEDGPRMRTTVTGPMAELDDDPTQEYTLVPVAPDLYAYRRPGTQTWIPVFFHTLPNGARYLFQARRATPKVV